MKALLTLSCILLCLSIQAQSSHKNLQRFWNDASIPDTIRLDSIADRIRSQWMQNSHDTALFWSDQFIEKSIQMGKKSYLAQGYLLKAGVFSSMAEIDSSLTHYSLSSELYEQLKDTSSIIRLYFNMATAHKQLGNIEESLFFILRVSDSVRSTTFFLVFQETCMPREFCSTLMAKLILRSPGFPER